jgi:protein-disulfide isomerase
VDEAERLGATGTPAFFINGRLVSGALPLETFERMINEELAGTVHTR